jgi:HAD superfamily hydrolase (TIGR01509 family)
LGNSTYPAITSKKHFLFDLDGTLVNSNEFHGAAFREVLSHSAPDHLRNFDYERIKGRRTRDVFAGYGFTDDVQLDNLSAAKQSAYFRSIARDGLPLIPGAHRLLDFLRTKDIGMYVVSAGSRTSVQEALRAATIAGYFTGVVTSDDVTRSKPNPEIYYKCLDLHGLKAADCVVVEDSASGITASIAAGIDSVLVNSESVVVQARATFPTLEEFSEYVIDAFRRAA